MVYTPRKPPLFKGFNLSRDGRVRRLEDTYVAVVFYGIENRSVQRSCWPDELEKVNG